MRIAIDATDLAVWMNGLPEPYRSYVMWLETDTDPAGNIREAACQRENALALAVMVRELKEELARMQGSWRLSICDRRRLAKSNRQLNKRLGEAIERILELKKKGP